MDSRSAAPDNQYISQLVASPSTTTPTATTPASWSRVPSGATTPTQGAAYSLQSASPQLATRLDLLSNLYPQQSLFRAQLDGYNKLISPGRGGGISGGNIGGTVLQSSPLPPIVPVPNIQAAPRPRSSSLRVSNNGRPIPRLSGNQEGHGNRTNTSADKSDRAVTAMGKESAPKANHKRSDHGKSSHPRAAGQRPSKSPTMPAQASSVPSTPHQRARDFSIESQEPSPNATQNHSPRSAYSETNATLPALPHLPPRAAHIGCIHETALIRGRRRIPYNLGTERLEKIPDDKLKSKLSDNEARKLTTDMRELYDRLKPTERVKGNREKLVLKLEAIFNNEWPGKKIGVHLFGSSGNKLCSDDSDVDICITTEWKELETNVCMIAELLAKRGMQKVVCVRSAKVPIVKAWDPELGLACDMNVNNTLALDNTRMILTYVEIDERVRPLAMTVKYWTRRRIINDAAFGGTLSSYTWICLIIAFLQLRKPPVLPALHQLPHKKRDSKSGFADDLNKLRGFGDKNKETLGDLLFHFFRFYAHEFDYKQGLSIRLGDKIPKTQNNWHLNVNHMLCVEEPFNTVRNLGNTADDTSFKGLHLELRRAFDLISEGRLDECCEQYEFPKEEERIFQKPALTSRPVILRASSQQHQGRGGRGGNFRGNRGFHRNGNNNRRASSSTTYDPNPAYAAPAQAPLTAQELQWYAQQQQQYFQSDLMSNTLNALQMQEHTLRFQLYTQSQAYAQQQALAHVAQRMQGSASQPTDRSRTNSFDNPPLTAPARPELYMYPISTMGSPYYSQAGLATLPSSPATTNGVPEFRRSLHRTSANADATSPGSLRSQSQPATRTPMPGQPAPTSAGYSATSTTGQLASALGHAPRHNVAIPSFIPDDGADSEIEDMIRKPSSTTSYEDEASRAMGYYVHDPPSQLQQLQTNCIPAFGDLGQTDGAERLRLSTDQLPQSILDRRMRRTSRSPSPLGHARAFSVGGNTAPLPSMPFPSTSSAQKPVTNGQPVVVNGSAIKPITTSQSSRQSSSSEKSEEHRFENPLRINHGLGINGLHTDPAMPLVAPTFEPVNSQSEGPVVVNGSNPSLVPQNPPDAQSFNQRIAAMRLQPVPLPYAAIASSNLQQLPQMSPRQRVLQRQQQGGLAPLDLAVADHSFLPDMQHLSPVYENRTPSPTVIRRFDVAPNSAGPSTQERFATSQLSHPFKDHPKSLPPKPQAKANSESSSGKKEVQSNVSHHHRVNGTSARENAQNGHIRGAKSENDNGWQKPKSRKKGGDNKALANGINHGEQPPKHEADRKGG